MKTKRNTGKKASGARASKKDLPARKGKDVKGGATSGRVSISEIVITKPMDPSSPGL